MIIVTKVNHLAHLHLTEKMSGKHAVTLPIPRPVLLRY